MMRELLEKWAALEPERCTRLSPTVVLAEGDTFPVQYGIARTAPRLSGRARFTESGIPQVGMTDELLAATIEAIEAQRTSRGRGWTWTIRSPRNGEPQHVGLVYYANKQWKAGLGDTPAEALLAAYLAALEAEGAT